MEETTPDSIEQIFKNYFGMTIEEFEQLDFYIQELLVKKVAVLKHKSNKNSKGRFGEIFNYYPIFAKTLKKRKSIFKR